MSQGQTFTLDDNGGQSLSRRPCQGHTASRGSDPILLAQSTKKIAITLLPFPVYMCLYVHMNIYVHTWVWKRTTKPSDTMPKSVPAIPAIQPCRDDLAQTGLLQAVTTAVTPNSARASLSWPGYVRSNRHHSAAPFPANGTAHASHTTALLGRGCLTNENSEAIFVCGKRV